MAKKDYYVEIPLTGMASGTIEAESEDEAIELFADQCTSSDIDWGVDASNGTARLESYESENDEDEE